MSARRPPASPILSASIEDLGLDTRSFNCLWNNEGLRTLGDIAKLSRAELLRLPNFGHVSLGRLEAKLEKCGIQLRGHYGSLGFDIEAKIDDWREGQDDKPSRSEAIRRLIERGLRK